MWFNEIRSWQHFTHPNEDTAMGNIDTHTWPSMGAELVELLTGQRTEITYQFDNLEVHIPTHLPAAGGNALSYAVWKLNGAVTVRSRTHSGGV